VLCLSVVVGGGVVQEVYCEYWLVVWGVYMLSKR